MGRSLWILTVAVMLSACASKPIQAPEPEALPQTWSQVTPIAEGTKPVVAWWRQLGDDQLDQLIDQAQGANADVRVMVARLKQARAVADGAHAARRPQIDTGTSAARERVPKSTARDTEGLRVAIPAYRQSRFGLQAEGRYQVDLLGRLELGQRAAAAELAASTDDLRAVRQWLALEVVQAYADLRIAEDRATASREASALIEQLLETDRQRLAAGLIGRDRLRESERHLAEKHDERAALEQERRAAVARLAELIGKAPVDVVLAPREQWLTQVDLSGAVAADLPAAVIEQRADLAAAWQRILAASQHAERTRLEHYPTLTLTGSTGFVSAAVRRWLTGDALAWVAQAALVGPLFDGGRSRARTDEAASAVEEQLAQHRKLVIQALSEVETALSATFAARQRVDLAKSELLRRREDRNSAHAALAAGVGSRPGVLQAELAELDASASMRSRRHELLMAWANAQKALGR